MKIVIHELLKELEDISDKKYGEFNQKIVNTKQKVIGVRLPLLRKIAKRIAKGEYEKFLQNDKQNIYELVMLEGLVIASLKQPFTKSTQLYEKFFTKVDSWAHIDATIQKDKNLNKKLALEIITKWLYSDEEFTVRAALVMMLTNFIDEEHLQTIFTLSQKVTHKAYYVHMANAWLIAECMAKFPKQTKSFFQNNTLNTKTHNKAIQKSRESFRVSKEDKEFLKTIKK